MKFRKNSGSKKREKSLEISRFLAARIYVKERRNDTKTNGKKPK